MRRFTLAPITDLQSLTPNWREVAYTISSKMGMRFEGVIFCEFLLAEEVIAMLVFGDDNNSFLHVAIAEVLRPYIIIYEGFDPEEASHQFLQTVMKHVGV